MLTGENVCSLSFSAVAKELHKDIFAQVCDATMSNRGQEAGSIKNKREIRDSELLLSGVAEKIIKLCFLSVNQVKNNSLNQKLTH